MRDLIPEERRRRLRNLLLALDSRIDAGVYAAGQWLSRSWEGLSDASRAMRVRGFWRFLVEILDEGLTWGAAAAVVMLALAQPAFEAVKEDWRARADLAVTFLDRTGAEIGKRGILQIDSVPLKELPDYLIKAALAIEDRRFYTHFGIDVLGTVRAMVENARRKTVAQGGSSITQQTAKNIFLSNERTLERKIKEAFLALWLEANLSKDEILKLYFDRAYMGGGTFGVEAAARFYFGKSAREVTLAEAAMLAGLFKAPTKFAPHINLPAARGRANVVLDALIDSGFMTEGQVHAARLNPATPVARDRGSSPDFYLDWAFGEIKSLAEQGAFGSTRSLIVKTALDPAVQKQAETSIEQLLRQQGEQYDAEQAALVLMDLNGGVRAIVGGRDYGASQFNRATDALRQPGSSFKPYVYATAVLNGYTPQSMVVDAPITIGNWSPQNYSGGYSGSITLMNALTRSLNTVAVRLSQQLGRDKVIDTAVRMGVRTELRPILSLPLGASEITVMDQAVGYATLGNGGFRVEPGAALEVSTSLGELIWRRDRDGRPPERTMPPNVIAQMNVMMHNVVENGTGRRARLEGIPAAGKTGTTSDYRDAWFVGYTGDFVCAVWYGNDDFSAMRNMTGGTLPATTWHEVMAVAHKGVDPKPIPGVAMPGKPNAPQTAANGAAAAQAADAARAGKLTRRAAGVVRDIEGLMRRALPASSADLGTAPAGAVTAAGAPAGGMPASSAVFRPGAPAAATPLSASSRIIDVAPAGR